MIYVKGVRGNDLRFTWLKRSEQILRGYQRVKLGNSARHKLNAFRPPHPASSYGSPACMTLLYIQYTGFACKCAARWRTNFFYHPFRRYTTAT